MNILCVRRYVSPRARPLTTEEKYTRAISYAVKEPGIYPEMLEVAAQEMADMISDDPHAILVPIPTSSGDTSPNRILANAIAFWRQKQSPDKADLSDLLADLMHYARQFGRDWTREAQIADRNYKAEISAEGPRA